MKSLILTLISGLIFSTSSLAATTSWKIDSDHSVASFKITHMMISDVSGSFHGIKGTVIINEDDPTLSSVDVSIAVATVDTGIQKRDNHLRSADFFDVAKYPNMTFTSRKVTNVTSKGFTLIGNLTINGVTKEVELAVTGPTAEIKDPWGNIRKAAKATTNINRKDFGLTWNTVLEAGGVLVGDEVRIEIDVQFIKQTS